MTVPRRHWSSYGTEPLPSVQQALDQPLRAFPFWFLRVVCDRCGEVLVLHEPEAQCRELRIHDILARIRG